MPYVSQDRKWLKINRECANNVHPLSKFSTEVCQGIRAYFGEPKSMYKSKKYKLVQLWFDKEMYDDDDAGYFWGFYEIRYTNLPNKKVPPIAFSPIKINGGYVIVCERGAAACKSVLQQITELEESYNRPKEFLRLVHENIPGPKIITMVVGDEEDDTIEMWDWSITAEGFVSGDAETEVSLLNVLKEGFDTGAGVTIRQFLPIKKEMETPKGSMFLPIKNLYGYYLKGDTWHGLSSEQIAAAHLTDANTRKPLPKEDGVLYRDAPLLTTREKQEKENTSDDNT